MLRFLALVRLLLLDLFNLLVDQRLLCVLAFLYLLFFVTVLGLDLALYFR